MGVTHRASTRSWKSRPARIISSLCSTSTCTSPPLPKGPRPAPRVPTHIPIEYEFGDGRSGHGVIQNVSVTGAYISTFSPLEAGTTLLLAFKLPNGVAVKVSALVVWMNENRLCSSADYSRGMGVVFKLMNQDLISALENYVLDELVRY